VLRATEKYIGPASHQDPQLRWVAHTTKFKLWRFHSRCTSGLVSHCGFFSLQAARNNTERASSSLYIAFFALDLTHVCRVHVSLSLSLANQIKWTSKAHLSVSVVLTPRWLFPYHIHRMLFFSSHILVVVIEWWPWSTTRSTVSPSCFSAPDSFVLPSHFVGELGFYWGGQMRSQGAGAAAVCYTNSWRDGALFESASSSSTVSKLRNIHVSKFAFRRSALLFVSFFIISSIYTHNIFV